MFLTTNRFSFKAELAKRFGVNQAIILQYLHDHPNHESNHRVFSWLTPQKVLKILEELSLMGLVTGDIKSGYCINHAQFDNPLKPEPIQSKNLFGEEPPKKKKNTKAPNVITEMTKALVKVMNLDINIVGYKRYAKFSKSLVDGGYVPQDIIEWYSLEPNSFWSGTWKGKQGQTPNQRDITETLLQAKEYESSTSKGWSPL